jgi:hypothetical protein
MRASMASRRYGINYIGGNDRKNPHKINNFWNNEGH